MTLPLSAENLNDPVVRHMRVEFARLLVSQTVGEALAWLRSNPPEGRIVYFYVVDVEGRLQGVVPTRRLLLSAPETPLAQIMVPRVVALPAEATVMDACEFFIQHRFLGFPVVDDERRLLGVVDVELYTEEISRLAEEESPRGDDLFQLIGVHLASARQTQPLAAFRHRFPWLACNLVGGILAAFLAGVYREDLSRVVALALFIPVVLAQAESVCIQSVSLALQSLHAQAPTWSAALRKLRAEVLTGLLLGCASGLLVSLVSILWLRRPGLALCLLGGIGIGVAVAAVLGLAIPLLLRLVHREPHVAAGPVALAAADLVTLLLYFNLARWILA